MVLTLERLMENIKWNITTGTSFAMGNVKENRKGSV